MSQKLNNPTKNTKNIFTNSKIKCLTTIPTEVLREICES